MTKPTAPVVAIELDKTRHLKFNFNTAARFEEATGQNLFAPGVMTNMSAVTMRAFLWACLAWEDPELTVEAVGELIDFTNIEHVSEQLTKVYDTNTPQTGGKKSRPLASPDPGTGAKS